MIFYGLFGIFPNRDNQFFFFNLFEWKYEDLNILSDRRFCKFSYIILLFLNFSNFLKPENRVSSFIKKFCFEKYDYNFCWNCHEFLKFFTPSYIEFKFLQARKGNLYFLILIDGYFWIYFCDTISFLLRNYGFHFCLNYSNFLKNVGKSITSKSKIIILFDRKIWESCYHDSVSKWGFYISVKFSKLFQNEKI